jgi:hypothetical protein
MRINLGNFKNLGRRVSGGAAAALLVLGLGGPLEARAVNFVPPFGTNDWDCVMSGSRDGIAFLSFSSDGTFRGYEFLVLRVPKASSSNDPTQSRNGGGDAGRGGVPNSSPTNTLPVHTNLFGSLPFPQADAGDGGTIAVGIPAGQWGFDIKGHIIGYFTELSGYDVCVTNVSFFTNLSTIPPTVLILTNVDCARLTNAVSFTGTVSAGKRLTLVASTPGGRVTYRGVPIAPVASDSGVSPAIGIPDMSGSWYGTKIDHTLPYNEFFQLNSSTDHPDVPNVYDVVGAGPGYTYAGHAMISRQKKMGFVVGIDGTPLVRAVIAPLDLKKARFSAKGEENEGGAELNPITFKGFRNPAVP